MRERTARYVTDGVDDCWFDDRDRPRPWMNAVPSPHLTSPSNDTRTVRGVIARYTLQAGWHAAAGVTLSDAVTWELNRRLVPHADGYVQGRDEAHPWGTAECSGLHPDTRPRPAKKSSSGTRGRTRRTLAGTQSKW